jgi:hypothetical protein
MAGRGVLKGIVEHARIVLGLQAHTHNARMRSKFEGLLMTPLFSGLSDLQRTAHDRMIFSGNTAEVCMLCAYGVGDGQWLARDNPVCGDMWSLMWSVRAANAQPVQHIRLETFVRARHQYIIG